jgi:hypothetical protein
MLRDRLKRLFEDYDPAIQAVISGVLTVEQEHISMQRPRVKSEIDYIIDLAARKELSRADVDESLEQ